MLEATYQAKDHKILPYRAVASGRHPALWVVTDNNMVDERGVTKPVFAPAPIPFDLSATSREAVMDAQPWTYQVSSQEAQRENRVAENPRRPRTRSPDPRRYVYVEACAETKDAALTFGVAVDGRDGLRWSESDAGQKDYRIIRQSSEFPNGCFRGAAALPADAADAPIRALRFRAYTRRTRDGEPPIPPGTAAATVRRVNKVFRLGPDFLPGPALFEWKGSPASRRGRPRGRDPSHHRAPRLSRAASRVWNCGPRERRPHAAWYGAREAAAEFLGTAVLIAFGSAVVAQVVLSGQSHGGYLSINIAWGLAVTMGSTSRAASPAPTSTPRSPWPWPSIATSRGARSFPTSRPRSRAPSPGPPSPS